MGHRQIFAMKKEALHEGLYSFFFVCVILKKRGERMPVLSVSKSDTPQAFDALPALKVKHFARCEQQENLYTQAQMYALNNTLMLNLSAFEKNPMPSSALGFCVSGREDCALVLQLFSNSAQLLFYTQSSQETLQTPILQRHSGEDEQGWYWGASLCFSAKHLQRVGITCALGSEFYANLFKEDVLRQNYGSAFPVPQKQALWSPLYAGQFQIVDF